ncbi:hypothetical protein [Neobacillus notoginsengisoli]|nr:hypothetical protein [Neobacillus notoginsengisoli]
MARKVFMLLPCALMILQGCNRMSKEEKEEIIQNSTVVAKEYFKEKKGWK